MKVLLYGYDMQSKVFFQSLLLLKYFRLLDSIPTSKAE